VQVDKTLRNVGPLCVFQRVQVYSFPAAEAICAWGIAEEELKMTRYRPAFNWVIFLLLNAVCMALFSVLYKAFHISKGTDLQKFLIDVMLSLQWFGRKEPFLTS
jgi:hypothetical protein